MDKKTIKEMSVMLDYIRKQEDMEAYVNRDRIRRDTVFYPIFLSINVYSKTRVPVYFGELLSIADKLKSIFLEKDTATNLEYSIDTSEHRPMSVFTNWHEAIYPPEENKIYLVFDLFSTVNPCYPFYRYLKFILNMNFFKQWGLKVNYKVTTDPTRPSLQHVVSLDNF